MGTRPSSDLFSVTTIATDAERTEKKLRDSGSARDLHGAARQNSDLLSDQVGGLCTCFGMYPCKTGLMVCLLRLLSIVPTRFFRSRRDLLLENLALRQQLGVFKRKHPRPRFSATDKLFWVMLRRLWAGWSGALILVQPETVVRWHRKGMRAGAKLGHSAPLSRRFAAE